MKWLKALFSSKKTYHFLMISKPGSLSGIWVVEHPTKEAALEEKEELELEGFNVEYFERENGIVGTPRALPEVKIGDEK